MNRERIFGSACPCNGSGSEQVPIRRGAIFGLSAHQADGWRIVVTLVRGAALSLSVVVLMTGCSLLEVPPAGDPTPVAGSVVEPGKEGAAAPSKEVATQPLPATQACLVSEPLTQLSQLLALAPDDQRREHLAAQQAFQSQPSDANRLRLLLTLALPRAAWRDDARVQRLLEGADTTPAESGCMGSLTAILLRMTAERGRVQREEQRRHESQLKDEQRSSELMLREEVRRYESVIIEERKRAADLKQKLDALLEIDRRLRRDPRDPRK